MSSSVRIAISSKSGCGNSTASRMVAEELGLRVINYTFKDMAREISISFGELCARAEQDPKYDNQLDETQVRLAREGDCVLASRLAIWLLSEADLKVYLSADLPTRAMRIAQREEMPYARAYKETLDRDARDRRRYVRLYGIDIDDHRVADLVVDTEKGDQHYVAECILVRVRELGLTQDCG